MSTAYPVIRRARKPVVGVSAEARVANLLGADLSQARAEIDRLRLENERLAAALAASVKGKNGKSQKERQSRNGARGRHGDAQGNVEDPQDAQGNEAVQGHRLVESSASAVSESVEASFPGGTQ